MNAIKEFKGWTAFLRWFDSEFTEDGGTGSLRQDWMRIIPFIFMHLACLAAIRVGWSPFALAFAAILYAARMFAITGFYHRYFSHKTFRTSRGFQFIFALLGASAVQRGPLWWAAHHRHHHRVSDSPEDIHSPKQHGFWWAHMGWITSGSNFSTNMRLVPDLARYPELVFLNRFDILVPAVLAAGLYILGNILEAAAPGLGTSGPQLLVWGFFISTVTLFHATCTINSLSHKFGRQRFATGDDSRNNLWLALLTFGEGWHNNHHHYQSSVRQGFYWWEIDPTFYALKAMSWLGLIRELNPVPARLHR